MSHSSSNRTLRLFEAVQIPLREMMADVRGYKEKLLQAPHTDHLCVHTDTLHELLQLQCRRLPQLARRLARYDLAEGPTIHALGVGMTLRTPLYARGGMFDKNSQDRDHSGNGWGRYAGQTRNHLGINYPYSASRVRQMFGPRMGFFFLRSPNHTLEGVWMNVRAKPHNASFGAKYPTFHKRGDIYFPALLWRAAYRDEDVRAVVDACLSAPPGSQEQRIMRSLFKAARALQKQWCLDQAKAGKPRKWDFLHAIGWSKAEGSFFHNILGEEIPRSRAATKFRDSKRPFESPESISKKEPLPYRKGSSSYDAGLSSRSPATESRASKESEHRRGLAPHNGEHPSVNDRPWALDDPDRSNEPTRSKVRIRGGSARAPNASATSPPVDQDERSTSPPYCDDHPEIRPAQCSVCGDAFACPKCSRLKGARLCDPCLEAGYRPEIPAVMVARAQWMADTRRRDLEIFRQVQADFERKKVELVEQAEGEKLLAKWRHPAVKKGRTETSNRNGGNQ